jgi:hypothetical protein
MSAPSRMLLFAPCSTKLVSSQGSAMRSKKKQMRANAHPFKNKTACSIDE